MISIPTQPLAYRLRPETIDEIIGQEHILAPDKMLYRMIKADSFGSLIFYGPPGTGKTTLAMVIAKTTGAYFEQINATTSGKADMQKIIAAAEKRRAEENIRTVLFIDEIHRFNKAQQDYLLPFTENGTIILIGATTENPYFEVNGALLSRSTIFELKPLDRMAIKQIILNAIFGEKGLKDKKIAIYPDALEFLADISNGDARKALNALELGVATTPPDDTNTIQFTLDVAKESIQNYSMRYDKDGDNHYDIISAFVKSMRGSDPDAALYYLARMLQSGEDVKYIARRIMIHASEDVGLADSNALVIATNAALAVERVGMPEAQIILAHAVLYIANAPKSNSACTGIQAANEIVKRTGSLPVPVHLQDAHYNGSSDLGHGVGYKYPHAYIDHYIPKSLQTYLPAEIQDAEIYTPSDQGAEKFMIDYWNNIKANRR